MRDLKNLGRGVPTLKSQVLLAVCAFGAGVLVNQHFTDEPAVSLSAPRTSKPSTRCAPTPPGGARSRR